MRDYSQYGEYKIIREFFENNVPEHKIVIDVGACGQELSNSYNLIKDDNWRGILLEPEPENYAKLLALYSDIDKATILNRAISNYSGKGKIYIHDKRGHHSLSRKTGRYTEITVCRLACLLKRHNVPHNFGLLTVDAEGEDEKIITDLLETSCYRPTAIIHEKLHGKPIIQNIFKKHNYRVYAETRGNIIYTIENKLVK